MQKEKNKKKIMIIYSIKKEKNKKKHPSKKVQTYKIKNRKKTIPPKKYKLTKSRTDKKHPSKKVQTYKIKNR